MSTSKKPKRGKRVLAQTAEAKAKRARAAARAATAKADPQAEVKRDRLRLEVVKKRVDEGLRWDDVAAALGISRGHAIELFGEARQMLREETKMHVAIDRAVQLEQLDAIASRTMPLIMNQNLTVMGMTANGNVVALEQFDALLKAGTLHLKVLERRAKILGTDAPEKIDLGGSSGAPALAALRERAAAARARLNGGGKR